MRAGLDEQDVRLQLTSQLQPLGENAVAGTFSGTYQRQQVKAQGIGTFLPNGGGAYIVAMAVPDKFGSDLQNAADLAARSMQPVAAQESTGARVTGDAGGPTDSGTNQLMLQMAGVITVFRALDLLQVVERKESHPLSQWHVLLGERIKLLGVVPGRVGPGDLQARNLGAAPGRVKNVNQGHQRRLIQAGRPRNIGISGAEETAFTLEIPSLRLPDQPTVLR